MNKKIILSFLIILCLLTSINFVLADENGSSDTSIDDVDEKLGAAPTTEVSYSSPAEPGSSVVSAPSGDISIDLKVIWKGGSAPDSIDVKILKDGEVVKTVALSEDNEWKATVELPMYDDNGKEITYDVEEADIDGFEVSYEGNQETGFIITNSPDNAPLKASDDSDVVSDDAPNSDGQGSDDNSEDTNDPSSDGSDDGTETPVSDDQPAETPIADSTNNDTDDNNSTSNDNNNTQPVNKTVKVVKKVVKVQDKDKKPEPKPMPHTGNPIAVLVLVLIGVVFASMRRRRD